MRQGSRAGFPGSQRQGYIHFGTRRFALCNRRTSDGAPTFREGLAGLERALQVSNRPKVLCFEPRLRLQLQGMYAPAWQGTRFEQPTRRGPLISMGPSEQALRQPLLYRRSPPDAVAAAETRQCESVPLSNGPVSPPNEGDPVMMRTADDLPSPTPPFEARESQPGNSGSSPCDRPSFRSDAAELHKTLAEM